MAVWLQKPTHFCFLGKQAGFQEDENISQHSWNKRMIMKPVLVQTRVFTLDSVLTSSITQKTSYYVTKKL